MTGHPLKIPFYLSKGKSDCFLKIYQGLNILTLLCDHTSDEGWLGNQSMQFMIKAKEWSNGVSLSPHQKIIWVKVILTNFNVWKYTSDLLCNLNKLIQWWITGKQPNQNSSDQSLYQVVVRQRFSKQLWYSNGFEVFCLLSMQ